MTCPGCEREEVALIGGYCGMCSSQIAANAQSAINDLSILDGQIEDVSMAKDGFLHIRVDVDDGEGEAGDHPWPGTEDADEPENEDADEEVTSGA